VLVFQELDPPNSMILLGAYANEPLFEDCLGNDHDGNRGNHRFVPATDMKWL